MTSLKIDNRTEVIFILHNVISVAKQFRQFPNYKNVKMVVKIIIQLIQVAHTTFVLILKR